LLRLAGCLASISDRLYQVFRLHKRVVMLHEDEHKSGDGEDGDDDELPCVIGESEGDCI